jgi:integrase/recombinase XerD
MDSLKVAKDAFLEHCEYSKSLSPHTICAYDQDLSDFLRFCGPQAQLQDIGEARITDFLKELTRVRGLSAATAKRRLACLRCLRTFFRWLKRRKVIDRSPFDDLELSLPSPRRLPRVLSRPEIRRLSAATQGARQALPAPRPDRPDRPNGEIAKSAVPDGRGGTATTYLAILLMTATGIRVGELVNIRIGDVSLVDGAIRIRGKGNRERTVFLSNRALAGAIENHVAARPATACAHDHLFANTRGDPLSAQALRQRLRKVAEAAAIERRVTPHMFRHTAATLLIEEGVDIRFVQRLLFFNDTATTEIYTHITDTSLKTALLQADTIGRLKL